MARYVFMGIGVVIILVGILLDAGREIGRASCRERV